MKSTCPAVTCSLKQCPAVTRWREEIAHPVHNIASPTINRPMARCCETLSSTDAVPPMREEDATSCSWHATRSRAASETTRMVQGIGAMVTVTPERVTEPSVSNDTVTFGEHTVICWLMSPVHPLPEGLVFIT